MCRRFSLINIWNFSDFQRRLFLFQIGFSVFSLFLDVILQFKLNSKPTEWIFMTVERWTACISVYEMITFYLRKAITESWPAMKRNHKRGQNKQTNLMLLYILYECVELIAEDELLAMTFWFSAQFRFCESNHMISIESAAERCQPP